MATTQFVIADNVNTQLAAAASSSATSLTLASSANLPTLSAGQVMPLTLNDAATGAIYEIVYVTAITGVTLTVTRAQEGTTAQNWSIGDFAFCAPTSGTVAMINGSPSNQFFVAPATQSQHAVPMAQAAGVVGSVRNLVMSVTTASASATLTADEIIVETALGGVRYCLPSFSKTINLATTGAGGMDTGSAPVSGYVALYAIYNPTTSTAALLATNAATKQSSVYGGANMPAGYTASALISVWSTNSSGQFKTGTQRDRKVGFANVNLLTTSTTAATATAVNIATFVPANAVSVGGYMSASSTSGGASTIGFLGSDTAMSGQQTVFGGAVASTTFNTNYEIDIATAQTIYYIATNTGGTPTYTFTASLYRI